MSTPFFSLGPHARDSLESPGVELFPRPGRVGCACSRVIVAARGTKGLDFSLSAMYLLRCG